MIEIEVDSALYNFGNFCNFCNPGEILVESQQFLVIPSNSQQFLVFPGSSQDFLRSSQDFVVPRGAPPWGLGAAPPRPSAPCMAEVAQASPGGECLRQAGAQELRRKSQDLSQIPILTWISQDLLLKSQEVLQVLLLTQDLPGFSYSFIIEFPRISQEFYQESIHDLDLSLSRFDFDSWSS